MPALWETQCATACPAKRVRAETVDVPPIVESCLLFEVLLRGGYPFARNDLSLDQWFVLGVLAEEREALRWQRSAFG